MKSKQIENRTELKVTRVLKIYYNGNPDMELDQIIEAALSKGGFSLYGSGYNFITKMRDLAFKEEVMAGK